MDCYNHCQCLVSHGRISRWTSLPIYRLPCSDETHMMLSSWLSIDIPRWLYSFLVQRIWMRLSWLKPWNRTSSDTTECSDHAFRIEEACLLQAGGRLSVIIGISSVGFRLPFTHRRMGRPNA